MVRRPLKKISKHITGTIETASGYLSLRRADVIWVNFGGNNVGDKYSNPLLYFNFAPLRSHVINWRKLELWFRNGDLPKYSPIIIGGGGVYGASSSREKLIHEISRSHPLYSWGAGANRPIQENVRRRLTPDEIGAPEPDFSTLKKVGLRDFWSIHLSKDNPNVTYVPCASAMHPLFNKKWAETREIGVVNHASLRETFPYHLPSQIPTINMDLRHHELAEIIEFIGQTRVIFTTSYHAAYWAALMGKKAVSPPSISSKFDLLKIRPTIASHSWESDFAVAKDGAPADFLSESRERNCTFYREIVDALRG